MIQERAEGVSWVFAIVDAGDLVGVIGLHGVDAHRAEELGYWIGRPYWGKGYASFAVKNVLEFAFGGLRLDEVQSCVLESNTASRRVLEKSGAEHLDTAPHDDPRLTEADARLARYRITRARWLERKRTEVLARLHPALHGILSAELAAGNEIAEWSEGWPDPDSLFVRLRQEFRAAPATVPSDVTLAEPNDPHWWKVEYATRSPRHLLVC